MEQELEMSATEELATLRTESRWVEKRIRTSFHRKGMAVNKKRFRRATAPPPFARLSPPRGMMVGEKWVFRESSIHSEKMANGEIPALGANAHRWMKNHEERHLRRRKERRGRSCLRNERKEKV